MFGHKKGTSIDSKVTATLLSTANVVLQHSDFTDYCLCDVFVHSSPGMNDSMMKCVSEDSFDEDNSRKEEEGKEEANETTSLLSGSKTYV